MRLHTMRLSRPHVRPWCVIARYRGAEAVGLGATRAEASWKAMQAAYNAGKE